MPVMTIAGGSAAMSFLAFQAEDNSFLFKLPMPVEEILETEGVDGRRWRTKHEQMMPTKLETIAEASSFAVAVAAAQGHRAFKGTLVGLIMVAGGTTYTHKDVHVADVQARPIAGAVVGAGASS